MCSNNKCNKCNNKSPSFWDVFKAVLLSKNDIVCSQCNTRYETNIFSNIIKLLSVIFYVVVPNHKSIVDFVYSYIKAYIQSTKISYTIALLLCFVVVLLLCVVTSTALIRVFAIKVPVSMESKSSINE